MTPYAAISRRLDKLCYLFESANLTESQRKLIDNLINQLSELSVSPSEEVLLSLTVQATDDFLARFEGGVHARMD